MAFQRAPWPPQSPEIRQSVQDLMESGDWGRYKSPHQDQLRQQLATISGCKHARLCPSGSAAVEIALRTAKVGPGEEVIVAAYDYVGNFRAIEAVGAKPVLVDVAPDKLTIDANQVAELSHNKSNIKAVIASHLYGNAAPIEKLKSICQDNHWVLIEDACQTVGMTVDHQPVGSFGDLATFSFGGSKPLSAGNGGAIVTNSDTFAARMSAMLDRPSDSQPLSSFQCAVLLPQLDRLAEYNQMRQATVRFLETRWNKPNWQWHSPLSENVWATHYKVAWTCPPDQREQIIDAGRELGLPLGKGFRAMSRSSERRCRKPFPLQHATKLGKSIVVLDHTALLIPPSQHPELQNHLQQIADTVDR